jgi:CHAT domain-containing protein/tetratricopeptide (TPR) repeat protein
MKAGLSHRWGLKLPAAGSASPQNAKMGLLSPVCKAPAANRETAQTEDRMRPSILFRRCLVAPWVPLLFAILPCSAETAPPAEPLLHDGFTQEREIQGGETQGFTVELQAGQFLRVTVQEKGIDVEVRLIDPQGLLVVEADSASCFPPQETEDLAVIADRAGLHRLLVEASGKVIAGRYVLHVEGPRMPESEDRTRTEAVKATWLGMFKTRGDTRIQALEHSSALWEKLGERRKAAQVLYFLGSQRLNLERFSDAIGDLQRSAELWAGETGLPSRRCEAQTLNFLGRSLHHAKRLDEARSSYEKAFSLARDIGDESLQARVLTNLGLLASDQGELHEAIDLQNQAAGLAKKVGDAKQGDILSNLAYAYRQVSENQQAIKYYEETLGLAQSVSNHELEALAQNELANLYSTLGDFEKSLHLYLDALALNRAAKDWDKEARTQNNIGAVYGHLGKSAEARSAFRQAFELARQVGDQETQTQVLLNESSLALRLGRPAQALKLAQKALPLAQGYHDHEADSHFGLGLAYRGRRDRLNARRELEEAVDLDHQRGYLPAEADARLALARLEREAGDLPAALAQVEKAIEIVESLRIRVVDQGLRTSFSAARQDYYELQIETLMALDEQRRTAGFAAAALKASEGARARTLLEVLKESEGNLREGADFVLIERERRLRDEVDRQEWLREKLLAAERPDTVKLREAEKRVDKALDDYREVQAALRESSPRYAALTQPEPLGLAEIQAALLDDRALFLEYSLGTERSFLWLVGPHSFESFPLQGRKSIEKAARRYYRLLTVRNARKPDETLPDFKARIAASDVEAEQAGRDLYRLILQPAAKLLGKRPLLVVADGALQYIPFAALPLPASGEPLGTRHEIVSLPSATALAALRSELRERSQAPRELAIFADAVYNDDVRLKLLKPFPGRPKRGSQLPLRGAARADRDTLDVSGLHRLPVSEKEANTIAALLPAAATFRAIGFEASKSTVLGTNLKEFRKLHFATHGVLDTSHPEISGLVLSLYNRQGETQDGTLRLNDIYNLRVGADLVVLSACRTALGKEVRGEGLIGLTRGFMYAGAARVLATLWSIEDQPTADLMATFYRGMLRQGLSPAAALRKAQLEMRRDPKRQSPYYWAGFSLQGEWR